MVDVFTNNHFDRVTTFVEYQQKGQADELSPACVLLKLVGANIHVYLTMGEVRGLVGNLMSALETDQEHKEAE